MKNTDVFITNLFSWIDNPENMVKIEERAKTEKVSPVVILVEFIEFSYKEYRDGQHKRKSIFN